MGKCHKMLILLVSCVHNVYRLLINYATQREMLILPLPRKWHWVQ